MAEWGEDGPDRLGVGWVHISGKYSHCCKCEKATREVYEDADGYQYCKTCMEDSNA